VKSLQLFAPPFVFNNGMGGREHHRGTRQDHQISEIVAADAIRLRNFIRRRVFDPATLRILLQEVF